MLLDSLLDYRTDRQTIRFRFQVNFGRACDLDENGQFGPGGDVDLKELEV